MPRISSHQVNTLRYIIVYKIQILRDKLLKQQIELKQLLKDAKDSPGLILCTDLLLMCKMNFSFIPAVACMLQYDDSPPVPHRSSTPAKVEIFLALYCITTLRLRLCL